MAIVSKTSPKGVDYIIDVIQSYLYANLIGAGWTDYECYPRANKNDKGDRIIPEVSTDPKNYKEVLFNDKFSATSFFLVSDSPRIEYIEGLIEHDIEIIWQVRLDKLFPSVTTHRADEELHIQLTQLLTESSIFVDVSGYEVGIENVYSSLGIGDFGGDNYGLDDLSEFHVVKYKATIKYSLDTCTQRFSPTCDPISIYLNGVFDQYIANGGSYNCITGGGSIDIDINSTPYAVGQSTNIDIPVVDEDETPVGADFGGLWIIANAPVNINDELMYTSLAEATIDLEVLDDDDNPIGAKENSTLWRVPSPLNTANIAKTGSVASLNAGDDADRDQGKNADFFNLDIADYPSGNLFGTFKRFTGTTGGSYNETLAQYEDVDGVATTESLAFPDALLLDHSTYNQRTEDLLMIRYTPLTSGSTQAKILASPYTVGAFGGFYVLNTKEQENFFSYNISLFAFDWPPISHVLTGSVADRVVTSTVVNVGSGNYDAYSSDFVTNQQSQTTVCTSFIGRYVTKTQLGL